MTTLVDHVLEGGGVEFAAFDIDAFDLVAQNLLEVLFVADEAVDVRHQRLGGGDGLFGLPELGAEVEIVGDDGAGLVGGLDGLGDDRAGGFRKCGEDAAGVEPADAVVFEEARPVDIAGLHAARWRSGRGRRGWPSRGAEADFGEVQADAVFFADAVLLAGDDEVGVDSDGAGVVADDGAHAANR